MYKFWQFFSFFFILVINYLNINKLDDFGKEIIENILKKSYKKIVLELSYSRQHPQEMEHPY
ncbi:unnamed protein product [marine sediment metagenome]|uniref:Uncharacterized protein n=1 Tax=marine sediment metagenome TaxID=412755 RepID=X1FHM9_9ZZZZ